jgi:hypothetical protein
MGLHLLRVARPPSPFAWELHGTARAACTAALLNEEGRRARTVSRARGGVHQAGTGLGQLAGPTAGLGGSPSMATTASMALQNGRSAGTAAARRASEGAAGGGRLAWAAPRPWRSRAHDARPKAQPAEVGWPGRRPVHGARGRTTRVQRHSRRRSLPPARQRPAHHPTTRGIEEVLPTRLPPRPGSNLAVTLESGAQQLGASPEGAHGVAAREFQ